MAAINGFRYPLLTDNPDIPEDLQFLATDVVNRLQRTVENTTDLSPVTGMTTGDRAYINAAKSEAVYDGADWVGHADDWITPGLSSAWVACTETGVVSATISPPQYRFLDGVVRIRGFVKSGATATSVFTLPVGMRPTGGTRIMLTTAASGQARVDINTNGAVAISDYRNGGTNAYVSLNINFLVG